MRSIRALLAASTFAALLPLLSVAPVEAQDGPVTIGHFVSVHTVDVTAFEEAARQHMEWHASQNDTWEWPVYQAMTGKGVEYVAVSPNHRWADFDNPAVDMDADVANWIETAGEYEVEAETMIWTELTEFSIPPADPPPPIVRVIEWRIRPGGERAIMHGIEKYKEAVDQLGVDDPFTWSRVVSQEGPPRIFIAIWSESFAEWDEEGPDPIEIMSEAHGEYEAREIFDAMADSWAEVNSRIWVHRPDLSYSPGM